MELYDSSFSILKIATEQFDVLCSILSHHQNSHHALLYTVQYFLPRLAHCVIPTNDAYSTGAFIAVQVGTILTSGTILSLTEYFDLRYKSHFILDTINSTDNHVILYNISCSKLYKHSDHHLPYSLLSSTCISKHPEPSCTIICLERL
jgi:hypothetical protein